MTAEFFLSRFTPSMMSADVLEKVFVQRGDTADRIVDVVRESVLTLSKHHTLVVGSRGIGKTHLLSLIQNRIASQDDLADKVRIAWLREEEWGVASFLDFLYRILRALATRYEATKLHEETEQLFSLPLKTAERRAADMLRAFVHEKTLLLIAENLDSVFEGLGKKGQQRLRSYLQEESSWTILASSQALFGGVTLYESPFYGFFDIHHLQELTVDDAARLVRNIAELANDSELAAYVQSESGRARIRAVHHLAGGNHRVYMILSEFLTRDSLDQLVDPFLRMMDDLTPYYQARMEQLSPQQRKIIDLLCSVRGAVSVKEIAKRCFISSQTASSQLKDLRDRGYVTSTPVGRDAYYELAEPLMRLALEVKNQRNSHVRLFLDFLRHWYGRTELIDLLAKTPAEAVLEREYLRSVLATEGEAGDNPYTEGLYRQFLALADAGQWSKALPLAKQLVQLRGGLWDWTRLAQCLMNLQAYAEALSVVDRALSIDSGLSLAWMLRSTVLLGLERNDESLEAIERAIGLESRNPYYHSIKSLVLQSKAQYEEGVESLEYALELAPDSSEFKIEYALLLNRLGRFVDSVKIFEMVAAAQQDDIQVFVGSLLAHSAIGQGEVALELASGTRLSQWLKQETASERQFALTTLLLITLYQTANDREAAREWAGNFYSTYKSNRMGGILGAGLVGAAGFLITRVGAPSRDWIELWREVAAKDDGFDLPLRLLEALFDYGEANDQRRLLQLPAEERRIVSDLLLAGPEPGADSVLHSLNVSSTVYDAIRLSAMPRGGRPGQGSVG